MISTKAPGTTRAKSRARSEGIVALPPEQRLKGRDALVEHLDLIDAFVEENPYKLDPDELDVVRAWKDLVSGDVRGWTDGTRT